MAASVLSIGTIPDYFDHRSFNLSTELQGAVEKARGFVSVRALYQFKDLAFALRAYSAIKHSDADYQPPEYFNTMQGRAPFTASIQKTFNSALKENGIFSTIQTLENIREVSKNPVKLKVISDVIFVARQALKFVSERLEQTPYSSPTIVHEKDNSSFMRTTKVSSEQTL